MCFYNFYQSSNIVKMTEHLSVGSQQPPKVDNLLRLYSMQYCPYAQRARLVLLAKDIPHDVVNIDLSKKPEWYFKIHPQGKVPALDTGSEIIVESLVIADYLDETYPQNPLYPSEPNARQKDKEIIKKIDEATSYFFGTFFSKVEKSPEEWSKELLNQWNVFEKELAARGTTFFSGDKPGMVDLIFWPLVERVGTLALKLGKPLPIQDTDIPLLRQWKKEMRTQPAVDKTFTPVEKLWEVMLAKLQNK